MSFWVAGATVVGSIGGALIGKQKTPKTAPPVDINKTTTEAIDTNVANFDKSSALATRSNTVSQSEANRLMELAMPGFGAAQSRLMGAANSDLDNENKMPQEMQDAISQFAAEKGIQRGTSGGFNDFSLVKDFGFNLVDWKNASRARALNTLSTAFGSAPRVNPMSPSAMFVTPGQALGNARDNTSAEQSSYNAQMAVRNQNAASLGKAFGITMGVIGGGMAKKFGGTPSIPDKNFGIY